jgi:multidrug resistance efflux pump
MDTKQAHGMLTFHQRAARAYEALAQDKSLPKKERERCQENAQSAQMRAAECQAILQVARMGK